MNHSRFVMEQEPYIAEVQEHIVFGQRRYCVMLAKLHNVDFVHVFDGGYDDYDGAMSWIKLPSPLYPDRKLTRFCPGEGRWMSGVRI